MTMPTPPVDPTTGAYVPPQPAAPPHAGAPYGGAPYPGQPVGGPVPGQPYGAPGQPYGVPAPTGSLAEFGPRVVAALVDAGVAVAIYVVGLVLAAVLGSISGALGLLVLFAAFVGYVGWFIINLVEQGQTGQSLGKRVVGLKLVRAQDGQLTGAGLSVGRGFAHCLEFGIGYLLPLFDAKKQTVADKICNTVVITAPKADWKPAFLRGH